MARVRAELSIERLTHSGEGLAHVNGQAAFVAGVLPGERVVGELEPDGKVLRGTLVSVLQPSASRRAPPCPVAERCGGCDWQHMEDTAQTEARAELVVSALEHVGQVPRESYSVRVTRGEQVLGYRQRASLHVFKSGVGYFARRSHEPVVVDRCPLLHGSLADAPGELAAALGGSTLEIETISLLEVGSERAVALHLKGGVKPKQRAFAERLTRGAETAPFLGVVLVPSEGQVELVGKPVLMAPAPFAPEVNLRFRPDAFSQANAALAPELVRAAVERCSAGGKLLELYAGNGFFTFAAARRAASVVAVEGAPVSSGLAQASARAANVGNVRFMMGDVRKVVEGLGKERAKFDVVLADPPRTGAPGLARWARAVEARQVVYVACDPTSLARDAKELRAAGFAPRELEVVDMFPQTRHVEAVMSFER